ncbi:MAG: GTPase Era [Acidobacteria bacterium]|nr:GTPase Era [Acidobacteriota bacterium]MCA1610014.1 GTPase Era [Acidobacteriota bacterium]
MSDSEPPVPFRAGGVAVVGRPNAGKSTLVNRLVGEKVAIVSDKPQTTRRRILGVARRPGAEIALVDTPGIHRPEHRMNSAMVRDATDALSTSDLVLLVIDAADARGKGEEFLIRLLERAGKPAILALNKVDLLPKPALLPLLADFSARYPFRDVIPISAKTGDGVERLASLLAAALPAGEAAYDDDFLTATPESEWIGEVVREKLLERTREELPFASAVLVESVREDEAKNLTVVSASIVVEKEGQKGIIVGRGGTMIRDIGTAARQELETRSGRRYFLELTVRVRSDWREDDRFLSRLVGGT